MVLVIAREVCRDECYCERSTFDFFAPFVERVEFEIEAYKSTGKIFGRVNGDGGR